MLHVVLFEKYETSIKAFFVVERKAITWWPSKSQAFGLVLVVDEPWELRI
jgi:hypothetical protein